MQDGNSGEIQKQPELPGMTPAPQEDTTKKKYVPAPVKVVHEECHSGNTAIMTHPNGGVLEVGGLMRGVDVYDKVAVCLCDIKPPTGRFFDADEAAEKMFANFVQQRHPVKTRAWLNIPCKDYGVPTLTREDWVKLATDILAVMADGETVVLFCQGGHGRTGVAASIIASLISAEELKPDPITWLRDNYCEHVVETTDQVNYVFDILGMKNSTGVKAATKNNWGNANSYGYGSYYQSSSYVTSTANKNNNATNTTASNAVENEVDADVPFGDNYYSYANKQLAVSETCQLCHEVWYPAPSMVGLGLECDKCYNLGRRLPGH